VSRFCTCVHTNNLVLFLAQLRPASIDLSKAKKLKDIAFQLNWWAVEWVITALQTITLKHQDLRQITIEVSHFLSLFRIYADIRPAIGETIFGQWVELDRLLVKFWESRSILPRVVYTMGQDMGDCIGILLPEVTKRGIIDLVGRASVQAE
jgi:hypothetical protein